MSAYLNEGVSWLLAGRPMVLRFGALFCLFVSEKKRQSQTPVRTHTFLTDRQNRMSPANHVEGTFF